MGRRSSRYAINKGFRLLLCVIDIYSKYVWVIPLRVKKRTTITNAFQKTLKESNRRVRSETLATRAKSKGCKPNKIWVNKGNEFNNRLMKLLLEKK